MFVSHNECRVHGKGNKAPYTHQSLCFLQELVEIVGRSTGIALLAPPTDSDTAQKTLSTLMSAVNKKQKVQPISCHCALRFTHEPPLLAFDLAILLHDLYYRIILQYIGVLHYWTHASSVLSY